MAKKIRSLSIRGASSSNRTSLAAATGLHLNTQFTKGSVRSAVKALLATGLVESVRVGGEKTGHLAFNVKEFPIIESISITGNISLKRDVLQREITTELEKPLSPEKLREDVARIIELYVKHGLERPLVSGFSEVSEGNRANLIIVITEHGLPLTDAPIRRRRGSRGSNRASTKMTADAGMIPGPVSGAGGADLPDLMDRQSRLAEPVIDPNTAEAIDEPPVADQAPRSRSKSAPGQPGAEAHAYADLGPHSASWSRRFTFQDHVRVVRTLAPRVMSEIDTLVQLVEARRFNDPETRAALELLRSLHWDLGELIEAVDARKDKPLLVRIARKNAKLVRIIKAGAKVGAVAPALTIGISHLLSALTGVPIDSTMVSTVFATMIAMPIVEQQIEHKTRPSE